LAKYWICCSPPTDTIAAVPRVLCVIPVIVNGSRSASESFASTSIVIAGWFLARFTLSALATGALFSAPAVT